VPGAGSGPNLRAAAYQAQAQQNQRSGSHSIIMPIYTFGIVSFFVFTVVKILLKKTNKIKTPTAPQMEPDPKFAEKVFHHKQEDDGKKLGKCFKIYHFNFRLVVNFFYY
jgi:large-conductance mechanosensitive channel